MEKTLWPFFLHTDPKTPAVVPPKSEDGKRTLYWGVYVIKCKVCGLHFYFKVSLL